ncbi:hypothetical protein B0682_08775 [Moraxella lincolnii]|uniref:Uncharacterized protein n=1 Tax=Lwoffella lincolnii TaxID=90241 RepID=A0A1T0CAX3_9GAMM|nr:hypothetical protein B0682_08775 [Moraxella lincolnii]
MLQKSLHNFTLFVTNLQPKISNNLLSTQIFGLNGKSSSNYLLFFGKSGINYRFKISSNTLSILNP